MTATRSGPIDPRLWRRSAPARRYLALTVACEVVTTGCVLAAAVVLAHALAALITDPASRSLPAMATPLMQLAALWTVRAWAQWAQARYSERGATQTIADIDTQLITTLAHADPRRLRTLRDSAAIVLTRGLDDLRPYFAGYLPAVFAAAILTPAAALLIAAADIRSALLVAVTVPLIPIFMVLIGLLTRDRAASALEATAVVSSQILDLIAGIPTLRALGRVATPLHRMAELGTAQRRSTMATLRVAFLSALVLELIATLSVALLAVGIGMRLVFGHLDLPTALTVLILAPEVYWPLRRVGAQFHAAADGKAASDKAFDILDELPPVSPTIGGARVQTNPTVEVQSVCVANRSGYAPLELTARIEPGRITVLTGRNGAGKSTALQAIAGLIEPDQGRILVAGSDLRSIDRTDWWSTVGWLPQRPVLVAGTVRENLEMFGSIHDIESACADAQFDTTLAELPHGMETPLGPGGLGLSLGERQRLCLARVLATGRQLLLLDEPTAHLDSDTEAAVLSALVRRAAAGATIVVAGHRAPVLAVADAVVTVRCADSEPQ